MRELTSKKKAIIKGKCEKNPAKPAQPNDQLTIKYFIAKRLRRAGHGTHWIQSGAIDAHRDLSPNGGASRPSRGWRWDEYPARVPYGAMRTAAFALTWVGDG